MTIYGFHKLKKEVGSQKEYRWPFRIPDIDGNTGENRTCIVYDSDIIIYDIDRPLETHVFSKTGNKIGVRIALEDLEYFNEVLEYV